MKVLKNCSKENGSKENAECKTNKVQSRGREDKISEQIQTKKIFKCEQCHKSSNSKQDLTIHMNEAHKRINSPNGKTTQNTKREICWFKNCDQQPASMSHCTAYCNCCWHACSGTMIGCGLPWALTLDIRTEETRVPWRRQTQSNYINQAKTGKRVVS